MNLHKPKALHRFSERRLAGREWENAGERTNAEGGCEAHACRRKVRTCSTLRALNMCYMLVALSTSTYVRHVGGRNGRGENWIRRSCGAKIRFGSRATGKLASMPAPSPQRRVNSCTKCPLPPRSWATLTHNWANAQCERGFICWNKLIFRRKCRKKNTSPCTTNLLRNS